ncbi:hypothetical protein [Cellulomonas sp. ICMP 17802]|uniref:hypothetical protein n=1 Tax=Cellulomonas sp. ICMP 17802 TaxID=3239199 RepID=UPI00351B4FBD
MTTHAVRPAAAPAVPAFATQEGTRAFVGRTGSAYAALGGGLVLIALGSEHLGHHPGLGVALAVVGVAELGWAVAALRGPAPLPRAALATLLGGAVGWLVAAVAVTGSLGPADVAAAVLQLGAAVLLAVGLRPGPSGRSAGPLVRLGVLALGSLLAATITVPGLASTDAGAAAPGMPGMPGMGSHHHG